MPSPASRRTDDHVSKTSDNPRVRKQKSLIQVERQRRIQDAARNNPSENRMSSYEVSLSPHRKRQKTTASEYQSSDHSSPITDDDLLPNTEAEKRASRLFANDEIDPDIPLRKLNEQFARLDSARAASLQAQMPMLPMGGPLNQLIHQRNISNSFPNTTLNSQQSRASYLPQNQPPPSGWLLSPTLARRRSHGVTVSTELPPPIAFRFPSSLGQPPTPPLQSMRIEPNGGSVDSGIEVTGTPKSKVELEAVLTPSTATMIPPLPERPNYNVPKRLQGTRVAMGEHNWNAYLEITEKCIDGLMTRERLRSETNKIFQVGDNAAAEKIRSWVEDMIVQWRRDNSPEF